jgi:hypothetical protein
MVVGADVWQFCAFPVASSLLSYRRVHFGLEVVGSDEAWWKRGKSPMLPTCRSKELEMIDTYFEGAESLPPSLYMALMGPCVGKKGGKDHDQRGGLYMSNGKPKEG